MDNEPVEEVAINMAIWAKDEKRQKLEEKRAAQRSNSIPD